MIMMLVPVAVLNKKHGSTDSTYNPQNKPHAKRTMENMVRIYQGRAARALTGVGPVCMCDATSTPA